MGFFDRFKKKFEGVGKDKKPRNIVASTETRTQRKAESKKKAPKEIQKKETRPATPESTGDAYKILHHVVLTEKASLTAAQQQYTFTVDQRANKHQVMEAVRSVYGVTPISVHMINVEGKQVRFGRVEGRTKDWKKAIVTLKEGEKINVYEGV